jgi:integrase
MVEILLPFVGRRGRGFRYRREVPPDCREAIGRRNWIRSWRPGTPWSQIEREARQLAARHDQEVAAARGQSVAATIEQAEAKARAVLATDDKADIHELIGFILSQAPLSEAEQVFVNALQHGGKFRPPGLPLRAALERDREQYSGDKDPRAFKYAVESFVAVCGDLDVTQIERRHVSDWLAVIRRKSSPATVKRRYGTLKALVGRAMLDLGSERRNPFDGFTMTEGDGTTKRVPFSRAMLEMIEDYLASGRVGFEVVALVRIMRVTGVTIAEAGGLAVGDVILDHATPHLQIRPNRLRRLKTAARTRPVPLVDRMALEAATLAVEDAKGRAGGKTVQVFPGFHLERGADLLSAKVSKAIRASGVPRSPRLTAHSFRHTLAEALRVSGASFHLQRRILGHASRDESDIYGAPTARLEELAGAMEKALDHLGDIDDANYSEQERMK